MSNDDQNQDKNITKTSPSAPLSSGLTAFDDLDRWFDNLLSRRWLQPEWRFPNWPEKELSLKQKFSQSGCYRTR